MDPIPELVSSELTRYSQTVPTGLELEADQKAGLAPRNKLLLSWVTKYLTMANHYIFHRPEYAAELTRRLLVNSGQEIIASETPLSFGAFLIGLRGIGKTTFLTHDLVPALEDAGAIVIYVTLEENAEVHPEEEVLRRIREALESLKSESESHLRTEGQLVKSATWKMGGLKLSFDVDRVGEKGGVRLHKALSEVVEEAETSIVLIIDEVQELSKSPAGHGLLWNFKTARDTINTKQGKKGDFVFVGAGSHPAMIHEMATNGNAAFRGADEVPYPLLGSDYVEFALKVFKRDGSNKLPSVTAAGRAFEVMGHEPRELFKAIRELQKTSSSETLDERFMEIAESRAIETARLQLRRVYKMGPLARAIFTRVASEGGELRDPISDESVSEYSKALGRQITIDDSLTVVEELVAANLIVLDEQDCCHVTNSLARKIFRESKQANVNV